MEVEKEKNSKTSEEAEKDATEKSIDFENRGFCLSYEVHCPRRLFPSRRVGSSGPGVHSKSTVPRDLFFFASMLYVLIAMN